MKKYVVTGRCVWYITAENEEKALEIAKFNEPDGSEPENVEDDIGE